MFLNKNKIYGTLYVEKYYLNNKIFSKELNEKPLFKLSKYIYLKEEFKKNNIELHTQDIIPPEKSDFTIYLDYNPNPKGKKNYLIVREPPTIIPDNHNLIKLNSFKKIFTWNDDLIDNKRIIKFYNQSYDFEKIKISQKVTKRKGYVMVCAKKIAFSNEENYSTRKKIIEFFENKSSNFEFYGIGWDKMTFNYKFLEVLFNRLKIKRPKGKAYKNYKGTVSNKINKCSEFIFQFSIENTKSTKGYISEKIFDSFFSNTIPIYSGAPNISNYIPFDCFINLDNFSNIKKLIDYTESLNINDHFKYLKARDRFLKSPEAKVFCSINNSKIITSHILNDFKNI